MRIFNTKPKPPRGQRMVMKSGMQWEVLMDTWDEKGEEVSVKARPMFRYLRHEEYSLLVFDSDRIESVSAS